MPDWPMAWRFEIYSTVLLMQMPDDATIRLTHPREGDS